MKPTTWLFYAVPAFLAATSSLDCLAATRTVQFAGLFGGEYQTPVGPNSDFAFCEIAIINTGQTAQRINGVKFIGYDVGGHQTLDTGGTLAVDAQGNVTGTNADIMMMRWPGGPSNTNCFGTDLPKDGMCILRYATESIPMDGRYTLCSGTIQVKDSNDAQPGSVVAAGAITEFQEMFVVGGTFSGALYLSGTHVYDPQTNPPNLAQDPNFKLGNNPPITNMNFDCTMACQKYGGMSASQCDEHCGGGVSSASGEWGYGAGIGWINTSNQWPTGSPSNAPGFYPAYTPNAVIRVGNPHYAGGLVMELAMGPMNQICSGNAAYWITGGDEFTHADGVDTHAIIYGNGGPAERLLCSHRHAKDDVYMQLGSSTAFPINGGLAF